MVTDSSDSSATRYLISSGEYGIVPWPWPLDDFTMRALGAALIAPIEAVGHCDLGPATVLVLCDVCRRRQDPSHRAKRLLGDINYNVSAQCARNKRIIVRTCQGKITLHYLTKHRDLGVELTGS